MKTIKIVLITVICSLTMSGFAQETYLKISKSDKENDYVMYPPGTKFELRTKNDYIIFKNSESPGSVDIKEESTLYVYPDWKNEADVFVLTEGKVEKLLTSSFAEIKNETHNSIYSSNGITAKYTVTDSEEREGKKNINFRLSNGITFIYEDDKYRAYLNDPTNYVPIKGKYIISSELGTLKLSFNSTNGVVWWVFEEKKE